MMPTHWSNGIRKAAHKHSWSDCPELSEQSGYPIAQCRVCEEFRVDTVFGRLRAVPQIGFYQHTRLAVVVR